MRTLLHAAVLALATSFSLPALAQGAEVGAPKPGKKCSVAAEAVGADAGGAAGAALAVAIGATAIVARRRRS